MLKVDVEAVMIVVSNLLLALAPLVHGLFQLAWFLLIARIVFSWVRPNPGPGLVRSVVSGVYRVTDPVLYRVREALPFLQVGGLDLSPMALLVAMSFADRFITSTLVDVGLGLV